MTFAKIKSSQGDINEVKTVYTIIGLLSGSVILLNISHLVHPSISAASSIARGMVSTKPFAIGNPSHAPTE